MKSKTTLDALAATVLVAATASGSGVCEVSFELKNKSRYVHGPVNVECGINETHSPPFGNWGVVTETQDKRDGHQFQEWCHRSRSLCDNNGDCKDYCMQKPWYQWNSCTSSLPKFAPPNQDFYNHDDGREQTTRKSENDHSGGTVGISVSCPSDTDGDHYPDDGGCLAS